MTKKEKEEAGYEYLEIITTNSFIDMTTEHLKSLQSTNVSSTSLCRKNESQKRRRVKHTFSPSEKKIFMTFPTEKSTAVKQQKHQKKSHPIISHYKTLFYI